MTDRYSAMTWPYDGPCPTCGCSPSGIPSYRPTHGVPVSDEARERHLAFARKRTGEGGVQ